MLLQIVRYTIGCVAMLFIVAIIFSRAFGNDNISDFVSVHFYPGTNNIKGDIDIHKINEWLLNDNVYILVQGYYCKSDLLIDRTEKYLLYISEQRAEMTKSLLVKSGINSNIIFTIAFGKSDNWNNCTADIIKMSKEKD